jgi:uncharacterized OB-fold protein
LTETFFIVKAFNEFLNEGRIMGSMCGSCGIVHLPPRPICPHCGSRELKWEEVDGCGTLRAFTVVHVPLTRFKDRCPYTCGVVELDAGPLISGMIIGGADERLVVGSRVKAEIVKEGDRAILCFHRLTTRL